MVGGLGRSREVMAVYGRSGVHMMPFTDSRRSEELGASTMRSRVWISRLGRPPESFSVTQNRDVPTSTRTSVGNAICLPIVLSGERKMTLFSLDRVSAGGKVLKGSSLTPLSASTRMEGPGATNVVWRNL